MYCSLHSALAPTPHIRTPHAHSADYTPLPTPHTTAVGTGQKYSERSPQVLTLLTAVTAACSDTTQRRAGHIPRPTGASALPAGSAAHCRSV